MSSNNLLTKKQNIEIQNIWDTYKTSEHPILDVKGSPLPNLDERRQEAIKELKAIIQDFLNGHSNIFEFKTSIDSYNKRNNYWGFTAMKGQMFFNQLVKTAVDPEMRAELLRELIKEPASLNDALSKIERLEQETSSQFEMSEDKRKAPNPASVGYFLSYFWQIQNPEKWPILYTSQVQGLNKIGLWEEKQNQSKNYEYFFNINEEIKEVLGKYTGKQVTHWDVEHAFWNFLGNPNKEAKSLYANQSNNDDYPTTETIPKIGEQDIINDYLPPRFHNLRTIGSSSQKLETSKGVVFEELVMEVFKFLDFNVEELGQGKGRKPDMILRYPKERVAFLVDTKAYSDGYSLGVDDRAIKEYINNYCPPLFETGYNKVGFIIVSDSFKGSLKDESFINKITWITQVKRFILLTTEALLYLSAFKVKNQLNAENIIETLVSSGNQIGSQEIIDQYYDM